MHRLKIPFPENSLFKNALHKDIIIDHMPSERRAKKTWPAMVAWRVNISTLSRHHPRIITSYLLIQAHSFVVVRSRVQLERAKRDLGCSVTKEWKRGRDRGFGLAIRMTGDSTDTLIIRTFHH